MHFAWSRSIFLRLLKFPKIIDGGPNFLGGNEFSRRAEFFLSPLLYFKFKSFKDSNSSSFIRFHCILYVSGELLSHFKNFCKLKGRELTSWGQPILQKDWIIWILFLYFSFKSFKDSNSSSFIRFLCILHNSGGVLFSYFSNLHKLKRRGHNFFGGTNSA